MQTSRICLLQKQDFIQPVHKQSFPVNSFDFDLSRGRLFRRRRASVQGLHGTRGILKQRRHVAASYSEDSIGSVADFFKAPHCSQQSLKQNQTGRSDMKILNCCSTQAAQQRIQQPLVLAQSLLELAMIGVRNFLQQPPMALIKDAYEDSCSSVFNVNSTIPPRARSRLSLSRIASAEAAFSVRANDQTEAGRSLDQASAAISHLSPMRLHTVRYFPGSSLLISSFCGIVMRYVPTSQAMGPCCLM